jgi:hypothetical protein
MGASMAAKPTERLVHAEKIAAVRSAVVEAPGVSARHVRLAAYHASPLPPPLGPYLEKVRDAAWSISDTDIASLQAAGWARRSPPSSSRNPRPACSDTRWRP